MQFWMSNVLFCFREKSSPTLLRRTRVPMNGKETESSLQQQQRQQQNQLDTLSPKSNGVSIINDDAKIREAQAIAQAQAELEELEMNPSEQEQALKKKTDRNDGKNMTHLKVDTKV